MENEEDIVEHALNWGIKSSGKRFHVSDEVVRQSVYRFAKPMFSRCHCEQAFDKDGSVLMCWMCNGHEGSITLDERLCKIGIGTLRK